MWPSWSPVKAPGVQWGLFTPSYWNLDTSWLCLNPENCSGYSFLGCYSLHSLLGIHLLGARLNGRNSDGTCAAFWSFSLPNFLLCCSWPCKLQPTQQLPKLHFLSSSLRETISLCLGFPSLHHGPKTVFSWQNTKAIHSCPFSPGPQSCMACCPMSEHSCLVYFVLFSSCLWWKENLFTSSKPVLYFLLEIKHVKRVGLFNCF